MVTLSIVSSFGEFLGTIPSYRHNRIKKFVIISDSRGNGGRINRCSSSTWPRRESSTMKIHRMHGMSPAESLFLCSRIEENWYCDCHARYVSDGELFVLVLKDWISLVLRLPLYCYEGKCEDLDLLVISHSIAPNICGIYTEQSTDTCVMAQVSS
jgi:hypothetical protein